MENFLESSNTKFTTITKGSGSYVNDAHEYIYSAGSYLVFFHTPSVDWINKFKQDLKEEFKPCANFTTNKPNDKTYCNNYYTIVIYGDKMDGYFQISILRNDLIYADVVGERKLKLYSLMNATHVTVKKGDQVYLNASGSIHLGLMAGSSGPEGISGFTSYSIAPALRHGCLMVKIGKSDWANVGNHLEFTAPVAGMLQFRVNDNDPYNNEGA